MPQKKTTNHQIPINLEQGKIPPQVIQLEEAVLGAIMIEKDAIIEVMNILKPESFYRDENQKIYYAMISLFEHNKAIDLLTVPEELRKQNQLEEIGGIAYITQLTARVASAYHIEEHARYIQDKFIKRELIRISTITQNYAFDDSLESEEIIDFNQTQFHNIIEGYVKKMAITIGEIGRKRLNELAKIQSGELRTIGLPSWKKVDVYTGGWQKTDLIIIAARPSMGKSRFAEEIARLISLKDIPVVIFSMEMNDTQIYDRELSTYTEIENMIIRRAELSDLDWQKIDKAQAQLENLNWYIDDTPEMTIPEFRAKSKLYKRKHNIELIIIDYLQLMKNPEIKFNREQEISSISRALKKVAKELDIPVIALSQLNRDVEKRADKTPNLGDLRESGAIEQDADIVIFLHLPEKYDNPKEPNPENKNRIEFIIAKHRNGALAHLNFWKTSRWTRILENPPGEEEKIWTDYTQSSKPSDDLPF